MHAFKPSTTGWVYLLHDKTASCDPKCDQYIKYLCMTNNLLYGIMQRTMVSSVGFQIDLLSHWYTSNETGKTISHIYLTFFLTQPICDVMGDSLGTT